MRALPILLRYGALALLIYMPLHLLIAQSLSLVTGGLDVWKIAKDVFLFLLAAMAGVYVALCARKHIPRAIQLTFGLVIVYGCIHLLFLLDSTLDGEAALLAVVYNNRLFWSLLLGYAAAHGLSDRDYDKWQGCLTRWLLVVCGVVAIFGVIQYFLPADFMTHLGYSLERGARPSFAIDDKPDLPRIFSSLRDPNSLGAFLLLPIAIVLHRLITAHQAKHKPSPKLALLLAILGCALLLTFSRSAWLGAVVVVSFLLIGSIRTQIWTTTNKKFWLAGGAVALMIIAATVALRDQYVVQNLVFHSDESTVELDPNEKRVAYFRESLRRSFERPLGHGPGTAGIVSIRNAHGGFLPENYYLQIVYEVGVVGLAVFVVIQTLVYRQLAQHSTSLSRALRASFWGLLVSSLLLHTWSNEAVMYSWWLLAGVVLARRANKHIPQPA